MLKKDRGMDQQRLDKIKKEFKADESEKEVSTQSSEYSEYSTLPRCALWVACRAT